MEVLSPLLAAAFGAVAGGVATYKANLKLARTNERQQALRDLYYGHVHEIYDKVIRLRDTARAGDDVASSHVGEMAAGFFFAHDLERALGEIEMVARSARNEDGSIGM